LLNVKYLFKRFFYIGCTQQTKQISKRSMILYYDFYT